MRRDTSDYIEFTLRSRANPGRWLAIYLVQVNASGTWAAVSCWDRQFDRIVAQAAGKNGDLVIAEYRRIWPTFFALVQNAADEQYGNGALTEFMDPDEMNRKWFVAVLFRTPPGNPAELDERVATAVAKVVTLTDQLQSDFLRPLTKISQARAILKAAVRGANESQEIFKRWTENFDWLARISTS